MAVKSYQIMTVSAHLLHDDAAVRQLHMLAQRIDDLVRMTNSQILQRGNHLAHVRLPLTALHDITCFIQRSTRNHGYAGLSAQTVPGLRHQIHAVDLTNRMFRAVGTASHAHHIAHDLDRDQILLAQLHLGQRIRIDRNIIIPLSLRHQITYKADVVETNPDRRVSHLLTHFPYIKGHRDRVLILTEFHRSFKFVFH